MRHSMPGLILRASSSSNSHCGSSTLLLPVIKGGVEKDEELTVEVEVEVPPTGAQHSTAAGRRHRDVLPSSSL